MIVVIDCPVSLDVVGWLVSYAIVISISRSRCININITGRRDEVEVRGIFVAGETYERTEEFYTFLLRVTDRHIRHLTTDSSVCHGYDENNVE